MHKVNNSTNEILLNDLDGKFISPLLQLIFHSKKEAVALSGSSYYLGVTDEQRLIFTTALEQIVISGKRKKAGVPSVPAVRLAEFCDEIVKKHSLAQIEKAIKVFNDQKSNLIIGNYNLKPIAIAPLIHTLFVDFLYVKLFDNKNIWNVVSGVEFSRNKFHDNFKSDNQDLTVCPYCDLDTINSKGTHEVEHFLPKSKFPLIAVFSGNLFSACMGCNKPAGKGSKVSNEVTSPYFTEVGEKVSFDFINSKKSISIFSHPVDKEIDGYIELLNLKERYSEIGVWSFFEKRKKALHESIQSQIFLDLITLQDYVMVQQDGLPLKYTMKFWVKLVPTYINT